jgi:hypothetical protein
MKLKFLSVAALGLALAACGEAPAEARNTDRYTIEIVGMDGSAVHYIHGGEDGRSAALSTQDNEPDAARLTPGRTAERVFREAMAEFDVPAGEPQDVQIRLFGQSFAANDDQDGDGHVAMNLNLPDGRQISLNAANSDSNDEAHVVMAGWDKQDVADYIDDIDDAPRELREEMKDRLGL